MPRRRGGKKSGAPGAPPTLRVVTASGDPVDVGTLGTVNTKVVGSALQYLIARQMGAPPACVLLTDAEGEKLPWGTPLATVAARGPIVAVLLPTLAERVLKGELQVLMASGEPPRCDMAGIRTVQDIQNRIAEETQRPRDFVKLVMSGSQAAPVEGDTESTSMQVHLARTVGELLNIAELRTLGGEPVASDTSDVVSISQLQHAIAASKDTFPSCVRLLTAWGAALKSNWDLDKVGEGEVVTVVVRDKSLCLAGAHEWEARATGWGCAKFCIHCEKEDLSGPCFAGDASIALAGGGACPAAALRRGALVLTPHGSAEVLCVVKTISCGACRHLAEVAPGTFLTPGHPVRVGGRWTTAGCAGPVELVPCPAVYNFVLSRGHALLAGGCECATLGHGFDEDGVRHPYLGSQRVVEDLRADAGWAAGFIERAESRCGCGERSRAAGEKRQLQLLHSGPLAPPEGGSAEQPFFPDERLLLWLHRSAMEGTGVKTAYREQPVWINGEKHTPPACSSVPALAASYSRRSAELLASGADPFVVAAFCLWWVAHLHPFLDGNGRAARGLCCAVLLEARQTHREPHGEVSLEGAHEYFRKERVREQYVLGLREANEALGACSCCRSRAAPGTPRAGCLRSLDRLAALLRALARGPPSQT